MYSRLTETRVGHSCADEVTCRRVENGVELGNQVPTNPGTACTERQHTRVRTRQHSIVDTVTSWFINEKQQQATKNNELKAKQHSDPHEPDIRSQTKETSQTEM